MENMPLENLELFSFPFTVKPPVIWKCYSCGWEGTLFQMSPKTFQCPVCGEFKNVHILPPPDVIVVSDVMPEV